MASWKWYTSSMESLHQNLENNTETPKVELESSQRVQKLKILDLFHQGESKKEEALMELNKWLDNVQKWSEADPTFRRQIVIEIARSDFYLAINDTEEALKCLDAASLQAQQEGHFDLGNIAEERITTVLKVSKALDVETNSRNIQA